METKKFRVHVSASGLLDIESPDGTPATALAMLDQAIRKRGVQVLGKSLANLQAHVSLVARIDNKPIVPTEPITAVAEVGLSKPTVHNLVVDDLVVHSPLDKVG